MGQHRADTWAVFGAPSFVYSVNAFVIYDVKVSYAPPRAIPEALV